MTLRLPYWRTRRAKGARPLPTGRESRAPSPPGTPGPCQGPAWACPLTLPGLAYQLADRGICTMDDLAELSVDELIETEGVDHAAAAALIMKAREPWFAETADETTDESSE